MKEQIENLIKVYKNQVEDIKSSKGYNEPSEIQTVSVLIEVIDDLKLLKDSKKTCNDCNYFVKNNQPTKDGYCNHDNIGTYDINYDEEIRLDVNDDFCCNKWEQIDSNRYNEKKT